MKSRDISRNFEHWLANYENAPQDHQQWLSFKEQLFKHWHELETENFQLKTQNLTDSLTGALKLSSFESELKRRISCIQQHAIIMIDMDDFKSINRTHGHLAGNQALRQISQFLRLELPMNNIFSRFGGDEFIISFPVQQSSEIRAFCRILLAKIHSSTFNLNGKREKLSFTIGATISHQQDSTTSVIARADKALLKAKENKKGSYRYLESPYIQENNSIIGKISE